VDLQAGQGTSGRGSGTLLVSFQVPRSPVSWAFRIASASASSSHFVQVFSLWSAVEARTSFRWASKASAVMVSRAFIIREVFIL